MISDMKNNYHKLEISNILCCHTILFIINIQYMTVSDLQFAILILTIIS